MHTQPGSIGHLGSFEVETQALQSLEITRCRSCSCSVSYKANLGEGIGDHQVLGSSLGRWAGMAV